MCSQVAPGDPSPIRQALGATPQLHRESRTESAGPFRGRRRWRFFSSRLRRSIRVEEVPPNTACVSPLPHAERIYRLRRFHSLVSPFRGSETTAEVQPSLYWRQVGSLASP